MKRVLCVLVLLTLLLASSAVFPVSADTVIKNSFANQFNVVFVNDESGSMLQENDPLKLRYEAIERFVALMTQSGNRIGSVSFNERILDRNPLKEINGFADKRTFINHLKQFSPEDTYGMTNIGLALKTAVELLDEGRDPSLPSIILLLTDGKTDLGSGNEAALQESYAQKADAIDAAYRAGYAVYSIGLGTGDFWAELEQISLRTGGEFRGVTSAADLGLVETLFYEMIFNTISGAPQKKTASGRVTTFTWDVTGSSVEEMNVIVEGKANSCEIINPKSSTYAGAFLDAYSIKGTDFRLIKMTDPPEGRWVLNVYAPEGEEITVTPLYNASYSVRTYVSGDGLGRLGEPLTFYAQLCDKNGPVSDLSVYDKFAGELHLTVNGNALSPLAMTFGENGFEYSLPIEEEQKIEAFIAVRRGLLYAESDDRYSFDIKNRPPHVDTDEVALRPIIFPFFTVHGNLDLNEIVKDEDRQILRFSASSGDFTEEDYKLTEKGVLNVKQFSVKNGTVLVTATDELGASCTLRVNVAAKDLRIWFALGLLASVVIALLVVFCILVKKSKVPFGGKIELRVFRSNISSLPSTRGGELLATGAVYIDDCWSSENLNGVLPAHSRFVVNPKSTRTIFLKTPKPVYVKANGSCERGKKFEIESGNRVDVYEMRESLHVTVLYTRDE